MNKSLLAPQAAPKRPDPDPKSRHEAELLRIGARFRSIGDELIAAMLAARALDRHGSSDQHPRGSERWALAELRDRLDLELAQLAKLVSWLVEERASEARSAEVILRAWSAAQGDAVKCLEFMRRYLEVYPEKSAAESGTNESGLYESFAYDTLDRVESLAEAVEQNPEWFRPIARGLEVWPMNVSAALGDGAPLARMAALLELGADLPGDGQPVSTGGSK